MPTILRFRNFRIVIFTADHVPSHVHARGPEGQIIFYLQCPTGPPVVRVNYRVPEAVERALKDFIADHLDLLCTAWEDLHGDLRRA